jgi:adenylosuccinate synthase
MPCTVIVGTFWGDEGKGKIISYTKAQMWVEVIGSRFMKNSLRPD